MRTVKLLLAAGVLTGFTMPAAATNWLQIQGTEPPGSTERFKLWGFIQPQYTYTENTKLKAGPWAGQKAVFNQTAPERTSSNTSRSVARVSACAVAIFRWTVTPIISFWWKAVKTASLNSIHRLRCRTQASP